MTDTCVWKKVDAISHLSRQEMIFNFWTSCKEFYGHYEEDEYPNFCPNCGKKIEVKDA